MERRFKGKGMRLEKGAQKVVELVAGVRPGERVLIVTDSRRPWSVAKALSKAAVDAGTRPVLMRTPPLEIPGEEPDPMVAAAMQHADVILAPTTRTLGHSEALSKALKNGARCIALTECTEKTFLSGGIEADFTALAPLVAHIADRFDSAGEIHITAPGGTDIRLQIRERRAATCSGFCRNPGQMIGFPDLEVYIAPVENKTEGRLVADASISGVGLVKHPVSIEIKAGSVLEIRGRSEAKKLQALLESAKHPSAFIIGEMAIGLNPKGVIRGNIIEDEGVYGTGHFALGNNVGFGGTNKSPLHIDLVYWKPTITMDGAVFMQEGRLCGLGSEMLKILQ